MTFDVPLTRNKNGLGRSREVLIDAAIAAGDRTLVIYLNGGSDTRRAIREHYRERYAGSNSIEVVECSWCVVIRRRDAS